MGLSMRNQISATHDKVILAPTTHYFWNVRLQWGRDRSVAEWATEFKAAFIRAPLLQWGRDRSVAECRGSEVAEVMIWFWLQWGRDRSVAECATGAAATAARIGLQWGRDRSVAECRLSPALTVAPACFNG